MINVKELRELQEFLNRNDDKLESALANRAADNQNYVYLPNLAYKDRKNELIAAGYTVTDMDEYVFKVEW